MSAPRRSAFQIILLAGAIAGTLDLAAAFVISWLRAGVAPVRVMHSISSGLLGAAAYSGGAKTAALGVVLHFLIATTWAAVFYLMSRGVRFLVDQAIVCGLIYGIGVYLFMNFVVLPLSAIPKGGTPTLTGRLIGVTTIMVCIGLPIALIVRRSSGTRA